VPTIVMDPLLLSKCIDIPAYLNSHIIADGGLPANRNDRGGPASCGGTNAYSVFLNAQLEGCYSPTIPGADGQHVYVAPADAGSPPPPPAPSSSSVPTSMYVLSTYHQELKRQASSSTFSSKSLLLFWLVLEPGTFQPTNEFITSCEGICCTKQLIHKLQHLSVTFKH